MIIALEIEGITAKEADDLTHEIIGVIRDDMGFLVTDYRIEDASH